ncbi:TRAP transporter small permease [Amphiplicatus metriothermophilus]|uniref:TRAP transporter small permease protein n=1 Tax=Amphiplicatus metriothermophilus TaxID=1519374 RepID=A0A239PTA8_9PROT|nr:TRAP transporter small permease [Amphiplicatus metriothermophilus]MBB5519393.1 TRAP-type C4-dicarboxylate transport system permease small subunit [Amphiplicatus metriothermophilus]SNT73531.1 TRAP-type C4-dicarboxylate transport system, small permease component [Amphiplicatus metriothermophilus]
MLEKLAKITRAASEIMMKFAAAGLVLMTVIVGWQVFGRYVLNSSPSWSEQASLTLMIWYVSFAAAAGVREGFHIRIVAVENAAPARARRYMRIASNLVVAGCGAAMLVWGGDLVARTWSHVIPSLGLPRGLAYLGLPIAGALIVLFAVERALEEARGLKSEDEEDPRWS